MGHRCWIWSWRRLLGVLEWAERRVRHVLREDGPVLPAETPSWTMTGTTTGTVSTAAATIPVIVDPNVPPGHLYLVRPEELVHSDPDGPDSPEADHGFWEASAEEILGDDGWPGDWPEGHPGRSSLPS